MSNLTNETAEKLIEAINSLADELFKFNNSHGEGLKFATPNAIEELISELRKFNERR